MRQFNTIEEAKKAGETLGRYEWEYIMVNGEPYILCNTNQPVCDIATKCAEKFLAPFNFLSNSDLESDFLGECQNAIIETYEKMTGIKFLFSFDTY